MSWIVDKYVINDKDKGEYGVRLLNSDDNKYYWVDVFIDKEFNDVDADWNQHIFFKTRDDQERKQVQDDLDNYIEATGIAVCHLEREGVIYQSDLGEWFVKK